MEVMELFNMLESNNIQVVEDIKKKFSEFFTLTKDTWLVNGLVDYYLQTNSLRIVDILVKVQGPHDKHFFDRLMDMIRTSQHKVQALTILGHVVRRQPSWLYKIAQHSLLKEILKLLKVETDIVTIMSALLSLSALLPMIPALITPFLNDLFEIFSRLASWNCNNPSKLPDEQLVHLQFGLVALFHRLYGMFPCNFFAYLQREYSSHDRGAIFTHTIKPLLETVKVHPLLVTANKDVETNTIRWKNMEVHDVVIECSRLSLDSLDRSNDSQDCMTTSARLDYSNNLDSSVAYQLQQALKNSSSYIHSATELQTVSYLGSQDKEMWSPSALCPVSTPPQTPTPNAQVYTVNQVVAPAVVPTSLGTGLTGSIVSGQEGASPPEAAVEATPETTPLKDSRTRPLPTNSSAVRALDSKWLSRSAHNTPGQSQPSSPMKKEQSPFRFPPEGHGAGFEHSASASQKLNRVLIERSQVQTDGSILYKNTIYPSSPLRIPTGDAPTTSSLEAQSQQQHDSTQTKYRADKRFDAPQHDTSQEDKEHNETFVDGDKHYETQESEDKFDECEHQHGSLCTSGGLHIPNSRSILDFARRVKRLRFYSQCVTDNTGGYYKGFSAGTSPADSSLFPYKGICFRRTKSCPEIKRPPSRVASPLTTLEGNEQYQHRRLLKTSTPGEDEINKEFKYSEPVRNVQNSATQTVSFWPQPYEHLFVGLFPQLDAPSASPTHSSGVYSGQMESSVSSKTSAVSPCAMLDRYIEGCVQRRSSHDKAIDKTHDHLQKRNSFEDSAEIRALRDQLELVHIQLQFERHRREVHAERNRRLLGKSRDNRALEESNSALRDQLVLLQTDIDSLNKQLEVKRKQYTAKEKELNDIIQYWQDKYNTSQSESVALNVTVKFLTQQLNELTVTYQKTVTDLQEARAALFEVSHVMKQALQQAEVGEQFRYELQNLQTEIVLMGEFQTRCREKLSELPYLRARDEEIKILYDTYTEEVSVITNNLSVKSSALDAAKARIVELEAALSKQDTVFTEQKRLLRVVKEENQEQLAAVENKYKALRSINQRMEEQILEMYRSECRPALSPDSSSVLSGVSGCGDRTLSGSIERGVSGSIDHGGSPLSVSLASSEGLNSSLLATHVDEIKNLQVIVDQPEQTSAVTNDIAGSSSAVE